MLTKSYSSAGRSCRVTFELPKVNDHKTAALCGEFNDWDPSRYPMRRQPDGSFRLTISLKPGRSYRFKYLLDGQRWENDWVADAYVDNEFGSQDSVVIV